MSGLVDRLNEDLKSALKSRDTFRVGVLRMLLARVKDAQIERGRAEPLTDVQVELVLSSYAKQRQEAAEAFAQGGRKDLHDQEMRERDVVQAYLPRQLDDDAVRQVLREIVAATGASGPRELGKVMGPAMARLQGRADGSRVQRLARELLGG